MGTMTPKQKSCIEWICETLGIEYYGQNTFEDASKFINKRIDYACHVSRENAIYEAWGLRYFFRC